MTRGSVDATAVMGRDVDLAKMPGHWLLARMGKRVLRPGGRELTQRMLTALDIQSTDSVGELAPGLGATARLALERNPASYVGVERDQAATAAVRKLLTPGRHRCVTGTAARTGLEDASATVVYGEAMLTMQTDEHKKAIVQEAFRILEPGGRYGIHELGLTPDDIGDQVEQEVRRDLSQAIRVGARPLTRSEWRALLEGEGFEVTTETQAPMHLLEPRRLLQDEGLRGTTRIVLNVLRTPAARRRVLGMRRAFREHRGVLCAVCLIARKPRLTTRPTTDERNRP